MAVAQPGSTAQPLVRAALWVYLVDAAVFGVAVLLLPSLVVETLGGVEGFDYVWIRWAGGVLLALAWAAWQALNGAAPARFTLTLFGLAATIAGLGVVLGWIRGEYDGAAWFLWVIFIATIGVGILMFVARVRAEQPLSAPGS